MSKPFAITFDVATSRTNHTSAWRTERPVYIDRLSPCDHACPAGESLPAWLYQAERTARRVTTRPPGGSSSDNPLPAMMGRVCYQLCETACNRAELDNAVGIHSVERFLGDVAVREGWPVPVPAAPSGKRVLVVG